MIQSVGPVRVITPGTPVAVVDAFTSQPVAARGLKVYAALFQTLPENTGKIYIGLQGVDRATYAQVLALLAVPTTNILPSFGMSLTFSPAGVDIADVYLDADIAGDGVILSLLVM